MEDDERVSRVITAVRVRPLSQTESKGRAIVGLPEPGRPEEGSVVVLDPLFFGSVERASQERKFFERRFNFDYSFGGDQGANQVLVYQQLGQPLIKHLLNGINCSVLAYGQTSSGKTHTMIGGSGSDEGLIPRLCRGLLEEIQLRQSAPSSSSIYKLTTARVSCSFFEILNEKTYDLLQPSPAAADHHTSRVREKPDGGAYVEGLTYTEISSYKEAAALMSAGLRQRAVAETKMNASSSRSHAIFSIVVKQTLDFDGATVERNSKVVLVDLAGSERASLTGATGERLQEANYINKSLSTLGDVIKALAEGGRAASSSSSANGEHHPPTTIQRSSSIFVPYRNSILTFLLKDSLGGNSRTIMLATVSPAEQSYAETVSTLRYIERAKFIAAAPVVHESSTDPALVASLQRQIVVLQEKLLQANKARHDRDQELRLEFARREEEVANEFGVQISELQEQLQYYQSQSRPTQSGVTSPIAPNSPTPTLADLASHEDIVQDVEAVEALYARYSNANPEVAVLLQELERLEALLKGKSSALASLEGATSSSASSSARLALCYKNERNVLHTQYQALLLHNQASLEHCSKVEALLTQTQTELAEKRALSRRLESDLRAKEEELQSARMECEYFKAKSSSAQAKHKQELLLLQLHVSKAKESEEALRREKETDMDKYTELLVDSQRRNEADRRLAEEKIDSLTAKAEQQGEQIEAQGRDAFRLKEALSAKIQEAAALESEATREREEASRERSVLQFALDEALKELESAKMRSATLETDNSHLSRDLKQERKARVAAEESLKRIEDSIAEEQSERRRLVSGEAVLKAALDKEAQELQAALENVTSTREALDEKDRERQDLSVKVLELNIALQGETTARQEAEKRMGDLHAELTKRKKKLDRALAALDENKAKLSTMSQLEARLRAAEAKAEAHASATVESDTRHAKKDQKIVELQTKIAELSAAAVTASGTSSSSSSSPKGNRSSAGDLASPHGDPKALSRLRGDHRSLKLEHSVLVDEVIELRERLDAREQEARRDLKDLERRRAEQFMTIKQALEVAEDRCRQAEERADEIKKFYSTALSSSRAEEESRRFAATQDVQQRLDQMLLTGDEFDAQYVAIAKVLSMIDLNMAHLDVEIKAAATIGAPGATISSEAAAAAAAAAAPMLDDTSFSESLGECQKVSPTMSRSFEGILDRQKKMLSAVRGIGGVIRDVYSSAPPSGEQLSPQTPTGKGGENSAPSSAPASPTHLVEHDLASMREEVIRAKLALAVAASENEDLQIAYKRIERVACDLKLRIATLMGELDDKDGTIAGLMDKVTKLQKQVPSTPSKGGEWVLNLSQRGK